MSARAVSCHREGQRLQPLSTLSHQRAGGGDTRQQPLAKAPGALADLWQRWLAVAQLPERRRGAGLL